MVIDLKSSMVSFIIKPITQVMLRLLSSKHKDAQIF